MLLGFLLTSSAEFFPRVQGWRESAGWKICMHNTQRPVPMESSRIILYPGELDLVLQSRSVGIYTSTVSSFRQIEDWGIKVRSRSFRSLYYILGQGSLFTGLKWKVLKGWVYLETKWKLLYLKSHTINCQSKARLSGILQIQKQWNGNPMRKFKC